MFWDELGFKCFIAALTLFLFSLFYGMFIAWLPIIIVLVVIGCTIFIIQDKIEKRKYGKYKKIAIDQEKAEEINSADDWKCLNCGTINSRKFCKECGTEKPIIVKEKNCKSCGTKLRENQKFCGKCGTKVEV